MQVEWFGVHTPRVAVGRLTLGPHLSALGDKSGTPLVLRMLNGGTGTYKAFRAGPGETQSSEYAAAALAIFLVSSFPLFLPLFLILPSPLHLFPSCF